MIGFEEKDNNNNNNNNNFDNKEFVKEINWIIKGNQLMKIKQSKFNQFIIGPYIFIHKIKFYIKFYFYGAFGDDEGYPMLCLCNENNGHNIGKMQIKYTIKCIQANYTHNTTNMFIGDSGKGWPRKAFSFEKIIDFSELEFMVKMEIMRMNNLSNKGISKNLWYKYFKYREFGMYF